MTRPAPRARRVVSGEGAGELADRRPRSGRPASRSASCSPTHRIGRRPASTARPSLRPISSSVSPASRRRSEWPTMTQSRVRRASAPRPRRCTHPGARDGRSGRRPPTSGSSSASASRTAARQTNGGQMTRITPGPRVRAAIVRASSPASAGVVCIFQLAATIDVTHRGESCQSGPPLPDVRRPPSSSDAAIRSLERAAGPLDASDGSSRRSARSARLASGVARRASATRRTTGG